MTEKDPRGDGREETFRFSRAAQMEENPTNVCLEKKKKKVKTRVTFDLQSVPSQHGRRGVRRLGQRAREMIWGQRRTFVRWLLIQHVDCTEMKRIVF